MTHPETEQSIFEKYLKRYPVWAERDDRILKTIIHEAFEAGIIRGSTSKEALKAREVWYDCGKKDGAEQVKAQTAREMIGTFRQFMRAFSHDSDKSYKHIDEIIDELRAKYLGKGTTKPSLGENKEDKVK